MKKVYAECAIIAGCVFLVFYEIIVHLISVYCAPIVILCLVGAAVSAATIAVRLTKQEVKK